MNNMNTQKNTIKNQTSNTIETINFASMRQGFADGLIKAGSSNKNIVVLSADLTESLALDSFKKKYPNRFFELGVAEQNLATTASGMARMGKVPFIGSYAVFSPGRNLEQIRTTICYNNVSVKIIGSHAGLNVGPDGGSHQALEDIAIMRSLPRMTVISPCDAIEAEKVAMLVDKIQGPTYIRLAREKSPIITDKKTPFEIGKANIIHSPTYGKKASVTIIATGYMVHKALGAAEVLAQKGIESIVINLHTIKPLDESTIIKSVHESLAVVTVEDHQIFGGMGSAVAELLSAHYPVPIEFVGVKDVFGQSGTVKELYDLYEMNEQSIVKAAEKVILRKK